MSRKCSGIPNAFIITSLKRPAEVELLRAVYGRCFVLVGVHATDDTRLMYLAEKIAASENRKRNDEHQKNAAELMVSDGSEPDDDYGQRVAKTYPMSDATIDASIPSAAVANAERLVRLMFTPCFDT